MKCHKGFNGECDQIPKTDSSKPSVLSELLSDLSPIIRDLLEKYPDCKWADWQNGLEAFTFAPTIVVQLWRNQECYLAGDPPKHTESYVRGESPWRKLEE